MKCKCGYALNVMLLLLAVGLVCGPVARASSKAVRTNGARDPYATAEDYKNAPPVSANDLAYRIILFDDFTIPAEWESDARPVVNGTQEQAIARLLNTGAFTTVARNQNISPNEPFLVVKCSLMNYRIVSASARFWGGVLSGSSYLIYQVQVLDGQSGTLLFQRQVTTQNSAWSGTFSSSDRNLPIFLGNVLADYLALRARTDRGLDLYGFLPGEDQSGGMQPPASRPRVQPVQSDVPAQGGNGSVKSK
ncbi:MAG: hypothetical protein ABR906_01060 [Terracidiphilus sp.]